MFVFAIWDTRTRSLLLGRDRFGKKPLYYTTPRTAQAVPTASSSPPRSRRCPEHGQFETTLDPTAIYQYLCFGFVPHPRTAYSEIAMLPPAHTLQIDADGRQTLQPLLAASRRAAPSRAAARTRWTRSVPTFDESVRIRLRSDVPVGVFLSGGIDSGLVTASAARASIEPLRTFSIGIRRRALRRAPVGPAGRRAVRHPPHRGDGRSRDRGPPPGGSSRPGSSTMYDQPYADSSAIPSSVVAREARKHLKVVLNGDGGDEAFAGYRRYSAALLADWMTTTLGPVAPLAARMAPAPRQRRGPIAFALRLMEGMALPPRERYIRWSGLFTDADAADLCQPDFLADVTEPARAVVNARVEQCVRWVSATGRPDDGRRLDSTS